MNALELFGSQVVALSDSIRAIPDIANLQPQSPVSDSYGVVQLNCFPTMLSPLAATAAKASLIFVVYSGSR